MIRFLDLKYRAFGLDINDSSLKIVKLKKKRSGFCIDSFGELKIDPGLIVNGVISNEDALAKAIKLACSAVKGKKLKTKYVVCSLPEQESFMQVIQMPKMNEDELKSAISFEAENYIPLPIDQVYLDSQIIVPLENVSDHYDVLVVAMGKKTVDTYLSCVKKAGLIPIVFEVEFRSISRALIKDDLSEQPVVLLDIGENNTDLVVFSGRSVRFTYSIPISSSHFTKAISESLGLNFQDAEKTKIEYGLEEAGGKQATDVLKALWPLLDEFVSNIKKHIDFYQEHVSHEHLSSKGEVKKIILCGGGASLKGLPQFLSQRLGIGVEVGDPFVNLGPKFKKGAASKIDPPSFAACIGLAKRAADGKDYEY
jgi:type IV pilus assembly protein PilM